MLKNEGLRDKVDFGGAQAATLLEFLSMMKNGGIAC